jgi:hypothetical protein
MAVQVDAEKRGFTDQFDPALLAEFAMQSHTNGLAGFDPAARQVPAADIAVLNQKHAIFAVEHDGADAKRHAARKAPIEVKKPPQRRLETYSQALRCRRHVNPHNQIFPLILASGPPACQYIHERW